MASSSKLILLSIFLIAFARSANVTTGAGTTTPPASGTGTTTPPAAGSGTTTPPATNSTPAAITAVRPAHYCLDGTDNSFVSFGAAVGNFSTRNFTVALWVQTNETLALFDIVGNHVATGRGTYFGIRMTGTNPSLHNGQVIVELDQNATGVTRYNNLTSNKTGLNDGNWHHLIVVRNGRNLSLYVDGKLDNSVVTPGIDSIVTTNDFRIGRSEAASAGARFSPVGCYGDLRVTYRAISAAEAANLFATSTH